MDFKAVEMQVALPRTYEASKSLQDQQQTALSGQHHAQTEMEKKAEWKRASVTEGEEANKTGEGTHQNHQPDQQRKQKKQQSKQSVHPYKGKQIDFSG
ncbi:hypothetical protein [Domibacillus enclensis]|uniref:Uncharacterized protein n=1 Tax=Domibacillus enclensis TaxID=1017273 RepID=A0A1N6UNC0_9BACI|nr:hypothetical protein [Domibacillus enclensis]OXS78574.1 hypothetical protein B1B05_08215 [Domibacillus enclensis]SIQ67089.1 hypothetical protein SAMN05443094_103320 [Domibacillus enclensis]